jgi:flagellar biosynthesis/type III secretory pathway M-ring protein FliF/YscJ
MFEQWGLEEWIILPFLLVAVAIIIWFLRRKIVRKFEEIELRQQFEARRKRQQRLLLESE